MIFDKCKLLRVYDSSQSIRVDLVSTSLLRLTSLTTLILPIFNIQYDHDDIVNIYSNKQRLAHISYIYVKH